DIDRGLHELIERIESWPTTFSLYQPSAQPPPKSPRKIARRSGNLKTSEPLLSSSLRTPKIRKMPTMADSQPQRYDPIKHRGKENPLSQDLGPGAYKGSTTF
ncbi:MAG: hypothetical protein SGPRY_001389, partial [Prymnesium sp.]